MAKLNRERRLRERRIEKHVKKDLRKREAAEHRRELDNPSAAETESDTPMAESDTPLAESDTPTE